MPVEPPVVSPGSLREAYAHPGRRSRIDPLAGGTDLLVQITGELGEPPERVIDLWRLDELRGIAVRGDAVELGALTTYTEIRRSPICREHLPALVEAAATIGAAQIQNRGTLGGNVMNASPAGDTLPVLLALDAVLVVGGAGGEREVAARRVLAVVPHGPPPAPTSSCSGSGSRSGTDREQRFRKVGTRRAQAISKVVAAAAWRGTDALAGRPDRARVRGGDADPRRARPRPRSRAGRATSRPSMPPSTRSAPRSTRSTTSGRRPPTAARPPAASSAACSPSPWRPA